MTMTEGDLIVLDNDERYSLLKKITLNDDTYFMAAFVKDDDLVDKKKIVYFRVEEEDNEQFVDLITSEKVIYELSQKLATDVNEAKEKDATN